MLSDVQIPRRERTEANPLFRTEPGLVRNVLRWFRPSVEEQLSGR